LCALRRVLTPEAFALLVFKYYYFDFWAEAPPITLGPAEFRMDELMERAKEDSRILPDHLFSNRAARQFFTD
jgi:hypothetical protein